MRSFFSGKLPCDDIVSSVIEHALRLRYSHISESLCIGTFHEQIDIDVITSRDSLLPWTFKNSKLHIFNIFALYFSVKINIAGRVQDIWPGFGWGLLRVH